MRNHFQQEEVSKFECLQDVSTFPAYAKDNIQYIVEEGQTNTVFW